MFGIDISHWDNDSRKPIDYGEILRSCDFVIIKAKDGRNTDPKLMTNYNALQSLKTGFYCYSYATTIEEAKAEARAFCELLKPMKRDAGLWLDVEDKRQKALGKKQLTAVVNAWILEATRLGYPVGLYSNPSWLENRYDLESMAACKLWLAVYTDSIKKLLKYRDKYNATVLQFTSSYKLPNGAKVDADLVI